MNMMIDSIKAEYALYNGEEYNAVASLDFKDLNREIIEPGTSEEYPNGAMLILGDDDFWTQAVLPYHFRYYDFETVCKVLWPHESNNISCGPDHGSKFQEIYIEQQEYLGRLIQTVRAAGLVRYITIKSVVKDKNENYTVTYFDHQLDEMGQYFVNKNADFKTYTNVSNFKVGENYCITSAKGTIYHVHQTEGNAVITNMRGKEVDFSWKAIGEV